jgi:hypothetical protein
MIVKGEEKQNKTSKDEKITGLMVESMLTISSEVTHATTALKERYLATGWHRYASKIFLC